MADGSSRPLACARQRIFHSGQVPHEQAGVLHRKFAALIAVIPAKTADGAIIAVIPAKASLSWQMTGASPDPFIFKSTWIPAGASPFGKLREGSERSRRA